MSNLNIDLDLSEPQSEECLQAGAGDKTRSKVGKKFGTLGTYKGGGGAAKPKKEFNMKNLSPQERRALVRSGKRPKPENLETRKKLVAKAYTPKSEKKVRRNPNAPARRPLKNRGTAQAPAGFQPKREPASANRRTQAQIEGSR